MNQILDYNPNSNFNKSSGSDKIVRVFAIILMIFAIVLIAVVGYGMYKNKKEVNTAQTEQTKANIAVEIKEKQATIKVTHDKNIQKLIYSWNTKSERTIPGSSKYMEETIDVPFGDNTLHIKVIDANGFETTHDEQISSEEGADLINPVIELSPSENEANKWKIKATDETALNFITYRWNEGEEETVYADEGSKELETEIEILKGKNDLTVVAVDTSNNVTTEMKSFTGLTKPVVTVTLSEDGSSINIKATHENGIESIGFNFNNQELGIDIGNDNPTIAQFSKDLDVGYNRIILTVKSVDGTETKFDGECTYGNTGSDSSENTNNTNNATNTTNTTQEPTNETETTDENENQEQE